jgi:thioredoxin reductase (NADPH)
VVEIGPDDVTLRSGDGTVSAIPADHVFLMTGFAPSVDLLRQVGVTIDPTTGIPRHDPTTLETNVAGVFVAGVVNAGYDANKVFIENGRFHGDQIVAKLLGKPAPPPAKISRDLDS